MCSGHYLELLGQVNPVIARVCPGLQPPMHTVEDQNWQSEIAVIFLMPEETEKSISNMMNFFKKENSK